jgi:hypothetical protein
MKLQIMELNPRDEVNCCFISSLSHIFINIISFNAHNRPTRQEEERAVVIFISRVRDWIQQDDGIWL